MSAEGSEDRPARVTPTIGLIEAAALLRCHPSTVRTMAKAGDLPGTKVGRSWVFYTEYLLEWLQDRIKAGPSGRDDPRHFGGMSLAESIASHRAQRAAAKRTAGETQAARRPQRFRGRPLRAAKEGQR